MELAVERQQADGSCHDVSPTGGRHGESSRCGHPGLISTVAQRASAWGPWLRLFLGLFLRAERRDDGARTFEPPEGAPLMRSFAADLYGRVGALTTPESAGR